MAVVQLRFIHVDSQRRVRVIIIQDPSLRVELGEPTGSSYVVGKQVEIRWEWSVMVGRISLERKKGTGLAPSPHKAT